MKIAFVGPSAVGKDTLSRYVAEKYNIPHISSGDLLREYVRGENLGDTQRENLQRVGNKLRKEKGGDYLVTIALSRAEGGLVLSGLRAVDEVRAFKKAGGVVIALTAPLTRRYEFAKKRGGVDDHASFEEFKQFEENEYARDGAGEQNVVGVIEMADYVMENKGTLLNLYQTFDALFQKGFS